MFTRAALGPASVGYYNLFVLTLLKQANKPVSVFELQHMVEEKGISTDTIRENIRKLKRIGLIDVTESTSDHKVPKKMYSIKAGAYCCMASLVMTEPLVLFPCMHELECNRDGHCAMMDDVVRQFGIPRYPITIPRRNR